MNAHTNTAIPVITDAAFELFGDHLCRFRQHLIDQNYAEDTVRRYIRCIGALAEMMKAEKITLEDLDEAQALELVAKTGWIEKRRIYAAFMAGRFVRFLSEQGVGKPPLPPTAKEIARAELRQNYEVYLRRQRGLSERTIFHSWRCADRFLEFRFGEEIGDLSQITSADITDFLQHLTMRTPPLRDKTLSSHLRNFFRYLFQAGRIATNLASGIPSVAQRYETRLPRHLTPEQVDTLLGAVRTDTPRGRRNYAMVLLLARLGLRPPEVIAMQIDDIDWRSGEIVVRGKGARHDRLPLLPDVGEALADYIRLDRVTTSRALFVTQRPPHWPFKDGQVLNAILKDAFARTGLTPPAPYVGAHILRHSLATNLVQRGASLEEISDTLRHRSRASTMIYARLDLDGLRSIIPGRYCRTRPYIYSDEEIRRIVETAAELPSINGIRALTCSTLFGLIAVTGLRISEALSLDAADVDLDAGVLTLRRGKLGKARLLPISDSAATRLAAYARERDRLLGTPSEPFFVSDRGDRLTDCGARYNFALVCQMIGLRPAEKFHRHGRGPRIHDLRHTFAVRTLVNWYRTGKDPAREIIKLTTYLGHANPAHTYWYIEAVPELLELASQRAQASLAQEARP